MAAVTSAAGRWPCRCCCSPSCSGPPPPPCSCSATHPHAAPLPLPPRRAGGELRLGRVALGRRPHAHHAAASRRTTPWGPRREHFRWRWITPAASWRLSGWLAASAGFSVYLNRFGDETRSYGAFADVAVLLLWLYLTGLAVLVGAEVNSEAETPAEPPTHRRRTYPRLRDRPSRRRDLRAVPAVLRAAKGRPDGR